MFYLNSLVFSELKVTQQMLFIIEDNFTVRRGRRLRSNWRSHSSILWSILSKIERKLESNQLWATSLSGILLRVKINLFSLIYFIGSMKKIVGEENMRWERSFSSEVERSEEN